MDCIGPTKLRFAGYTLDLARIALLHDEGEVPLRPKAFNLLRYMAENPGRLIKKEELIAKVWPGVFVTDDSLVQCVKDVREALGDHAHLIIRTLPRRGYMFAAEVVDGAASDAVAATRYARSGDVHIAYQTFGAGAVDLVFIPGFVSHIESYWEEPRFARWLRRLGRFARVIIFDKRGTGLSDRVSELPGMQERIDDVRAVMDAAGVRRAAIMGVSEGGALAALFAATQPHRCQALVLYGAFARFTSWVPSEEALEELFQYIETEWGSGKSVATFAPSMAENAAFREWWGKFERLGASPAAAIALLRMNKQIDITDILSSIHVPTLVLHRTDDATVEVEAGRSLATRIPGARYLELPGVDHLNFVGDNVDKILDAIETFVAAPGAAPAIDRLLRTILVMSTSGALPDAQQRIVREEVARSRGQTVTSHAGNFVAIFDGPARAVHSALAINAALKRLGVGSSIGLHTGEIELVGDEARGIALEIAVGVRSRAEGGDVVVSRTVKDLVAGSGLSFNDVGAHRLAGLPEPWQLYRAGV